MMRNTLLRELVTSQSITVATQAVVKSNPLMSRDLKKHAREAEKMRLPGWLAEYDNTSPMFEEDTIPLKAASPLHLSWFSYRLQDERELPQHVSGMDIDTFWKTIVQGFSAATFSGPALATVGLPVATCVEEQYAREFYRSMNNLTNGACVAIPEYGMEPSTQPGQIHFYVPAKNWGFEILYDEDTVSGHPSQFAPGGSYYPWVEQGVLKGYAMLDFRTTVPTIPHPGMCLLLCSRATLTPFDF